MNKFTYLIMIILHVVMITSCAPLFCAITGKTCKTIKLVDNEGKAITSGSAGGDPLAPSIMNSSDTNGKLVLSSHWANPDTDEVTIGAPGFDPYIIKFNEVPKLVVMKKFQVKFCRASILDQIH